MTEPRLTTHDCHDCTTHYCQVSATTTEGSRSTAHDNDWFQSLIIYPGMSLLPPWQIPCAAVLDDVVCRLVRAHSHQLLHIHLDGSRLLTAAAVSQLAHHCPALRSVTLVGCSSVGSAAIRFLSRCCTQLEVLRVAGCALADADLNFDGGAADEAAQSIANSCSMLRSVSLSS